MTQAFKIETDPATLEAAQKAYELTAACQFRITEFLRRPDAKTQAEFLCAVGTLAREAARLAELDLPHPEPPPPAA